MKRGSNLLERYSAKLLFQFRVVTDGATNMKRTCEERIILLKSQSAVRALSEAKRHGRKAEHAYKNDAGGTVYFEFIGVTDLQHLSIECDENEVWYAIKDLMTPMERRDKLVPSEENLSAIAWEKSRPTSASNRRPRLRRPRG